MHTHIVLFADFEKAFFSVMACPDYWKGTQEGKMIEANAMRFFNRFKFDYGSLVGVMTKKRVRGTLYYVNKMGNMNIYCARGEGFNMLNSDIDRIINILFPRIN